MHGSSRCRRNRVLRSTLVALVAIPVGACGGGRSVEAFCSTLRSEKERILAEFDRTSSAADGTGDELAQHLLGLGASVQAIGELKTYFAKLADVAPEEIRVDAEIVADKMDDLTDAPDLSLGGIATQLFNGMAISGQMNTLNQFALDHCGESI